jgi:hypothetical protein
MLVQVSCHQHCLLLLKTKVFYLDHRQQLEHSRHRSLTNYMINIVACLVAYSYQEKKPALNLRREDLLPLL